MTKREARYDRKDLVRILRAFAEPVPDGFLLLDETGTLLAASRDARRLMDLLGGGDAGRGLESLKAHLDLDAAGAWQEAERDDVELLGRVYRVEMGEVPFGGAAGGGSRGRVVVLRDASRERELARVKSEFFANTSHELRTPLNAIIGFTELSMDEDDGTLSETHRHNLSRVLVNAKNLLRMINDILDLAKLESYKMDVHIQPVSVPELVSEAAGSVRALAADKGLEIEIDLGDGLPEMRTDPEKVKRILLNLLSNAVKYTEKGYVRLAVRAVQDDQVEFSVQDSGIGIPAGELPSLFERFHQVDGSPTRKVGGAGLGLSLVKELSYLMGGRVGVESVPGSGSTFRVVFPRQITYARRRRED